jgi:hypothetical protein
VEADNKSNAAVHYTRSKLLIVIAERIQSHPQEEYNRIFRFIGARYDLQRDGSAISKHRFVKSCFICYLCSDFTFEAEDEHVGTYAGKMNKRVEKRVSEQTINIESV